MWCHCCVVCPHGWLPGNVQDGPVRWGYAGGPLWPEPSHGAPSRPLHIWQVSLHVYPVWLWLSAQSSRHWARKSLQAPQDHKANEHEKGKLMSDCINYCAVVRVLYWGVAWSNCGVYFIPLSFGRGIMLFGFFIVKSRYKQIILHFWNFLDQRPKSQCEQDCYFQPIISPK